MELFYLNLVCCYCHSVLLFFKATGESVPLTNEMADGTMGRDSHLYVIYIAVSPSTNILIVSVKCKCKGLD